MVPVRLLSAVLIATFAVCNGSRILVIPSGSFSHLLEMLPIANQLVSRNHEIFVLVKSTQQERIAKLNKRYNVITYSALSTMKLDDERDNEIFSPTTSFRGVNLLLAEVRKICESLLQDAEMWQLLESLHFDLAMVDNFIMPCTFLIPHRLGIPYVSTGTHVFPAYSSLPWLPSVNPLLISLENMGVHICSEDSNCPGVLIRLRRFLEYLIVYFAESNSNYLQQYVNFTSVKAVRLNVSLTIINLDHILEVSPLPQLPGVEYVGGLTVKPANPLPSDLQSFMDASECVAVVSFGTRVANVDNSVTQKLLDAFANVRCQVLFRCVTCDALQLPSNVRVAGWIPQNDLLAHRNTKVFVTHSGNNGQYEALYHGVPMVAFYVDGDQLRNSRRVERKCFGRRISMYDFDSAQLTSVMNDVIESDKYRKAIQKASEIFRIPEHPAARAANAIERVLQYGDEYTKFGAAELSGIEFYSIDVLFTIATLILCMFYLLCRFLAYCFALLLSSKAKNV